LKYIILLMITLNIYAGGENDTGVFIEAGRYIDVVGSHDRFELHKDINLYNQASFLEEKGIFLLKTRSRVVAINDSQIIKKYKKIKSSIDSKVLEETMFGETETEARKYILEIMNLQEFNPFNKSDF